MFTDEDFVAAEATDRPQNFDGNHDPELQSADEIAPQSTENNFSEGRLRHENTIKFYCLTCRIGLTKMKLSLILHRSKC